MGGECFRFLGLKEGAKVTKEHDQIYQTLVSIIADTVESWAKNQDPDEIQVFDDKENALEIKCKDSRFNGHILIPRHLCSSLRVGWQHRCYGSARDPQHEIANEIIDLLLDSDLRPLLQVNEEDNIASDLGADDFLYEQFPDIVHTKGPFHTPGMDYCWSPHGMYGGYDDWEVYRDAHDLD